ncbi:LysR family transcriptional regulator [Chitinivorax sp. B]|uniref:LysR family transcriptional regulator n=1 Tax=Chitinivorax sp. B TaxID=2502235 RepID=UPI0010F89BEE|nr:LysR family transcriptional regulator [Chitinivorax sp. B]
MKRQLDDLQLGSMELFCLAAELGSFTAAATAAGVTPAAVSRSVSRLEARLGVRLFQRTTRHILLTDGGRLYFAQCRQALNLLVEAEREVTGQQVAPVGCLRISCSTAYGHYRLLPMLPAFRARFPGVQIEIHLCNRNIDFAGEGFDLAIRARPPTDSSLIARKLEDAMLVVVATPDYLARVGTPTTLEALRQHSCIQFELPSSGKRISWQFQQDGNDVDVITEGDYFVSEEVLGVATLARSGAGLCQTYRFVVAEDLRQGTLVEVLQPFAGRSRPFSLLYPHGRHTPQRVRVFIDYMIAELGSVKASLHESGFR